MFHSGILFPESPSAMMAKSYTQAANRWAPPAFLASDITVAQLWILP